MYKYGFILIIYIFIIHCSFEAPVEIVHSDYTPEISVFAVISNDPNYHFVIVERTRYLNEDALGQDSFYIIDDAIVKIINNQDTIQFIFNKKSNDYRQWLNNYNYDFKGIYLDIHNELNPQPGETYRLLIEMPDGRTVTGTTTFPNHPEISNPLTNEVIKIEDIRNTRIEWLDDSNTPAYFVRLILNYLGYRRIPGYRENILSDDKIIYNSPTILENIDYSYYFDSYDSYEDYYSYKSYSDTATIKILALDNNLYDYYSKAQMEKLTGKELDLLDGGVGVFGSISSDSVNVILQ